MSKFEVGNRVKLDGVHMGTVLDVSKSPGKVVVEMDDPALGTEASQFPGRKVWWLSEDRFTKVRAARKILITHDGATTLARLFEGNKVVKSAEAKCSPSDSFDFAVGASLAYDRLMDRLAKAAPEKPAAEPIKLYCVKDYPRLAYSLSKGEVYQLKDGRMCDSAGNVLSSFVGDYYTFSNYKERNPDYGAVLVPLVSRPAKVGEWVYITEGRAIGVIGKVLDIDPAGRPLVRHRDVWGMSAYEDGMEHTRFNLSDYLVLDGYQPEPKPEPEYWSGKVVCVDNDEDDGLTTGKVYKVEKGVMRWDNGDVMSHVFKSVDDLNDKFSREPHTKAKFIEFKGEASD